MLRSALLLALAVGCKGDPTDTSDPTTDTDLLCSDVFYADADGDGHGDPGAEVVGCDVPAGAVVSGTDCDDSDAGVNPDAAEVADDGVDQDCNGTDSVTCYVDSDGDGYGVSTVVVSDDGPCDAGSGESAFTGDCDDADANTNPGADDTPDDGVDADCDGVDPRHLLPRPRRRRLRLRCLADGRRRRV